MQIASCKYIADCPISYLSVSIYRNNIMFQYGINFNVIYLVNVS